VNGELFLNNAALGVYARFVAEREKIQPTIGKFPAAGIVSIKLFLRHQNYRLGFNIDGHKIERTTPLVFIGNNQYQIDRLGFPARTNLEGGKLSLYVLRRAGRRQLAKLAWRTTVGKDEPPEIVEAFTPKQVTVTSRRHRTMLVALDGEVSRMKLPLKVEMNSKNLRVLDAHIKK
jgi:diacylglycerol kinase family enzyme